MCMCFFYQKVNEFNTMMNDLNEIIEKRLQKDRLMMTSKTIHDRHAVIKKSVLRHSDDQII